MKPCSIAILGAGSWGTALAILLHRNLHQISLWGRLEDGVMELARDRVNKRFLPGIVVPADIRVTADLEQALAGAEIVVLSVPSQALRSVLKQSESLIDPSAILVNTAKGMELGTGYRLSQVVADQWGAETMDRFAVLSGPSHAEEVGQGLPTAVVVASKNREVANRVQDAFMTRDFRVYTIDDLIGVEMGGSLKNIIALATGIAEGLGFGDNTKAALLTRGLAEITRMGVRMGAQPETFAGLSGLGDLVVTCNSPHSRNGRAGRLIGRGMSVDEAVREVGMVVEGITTTRVADEMAAALGVSMPITRTVYEVLFEGKDAKTAVWELMGRDKKDEN